MERVRQSTTGYRRASALVVPLGISMGILARVRQPNQHHAASRQSTAHLVPGTGDDRPGDHPPLDHCHHRTGTDDDHHGTGTVDYHHGTGTVDYRTTGDGAYPIHHHHRRGLGGHGLRDGGRELLPRSRRERPRLPHNHLYA